MLLLLLITWQGQPKIVLWSFWRYATGAECVFVPVTKSTKILFFEGWTKHCPWKHVCLNLEVFLLSSSSGGIFLGIEFSPSECLVVSSRMELNKLLSSQTTQVRFGGSGLLQGSEVQSTKAHLSVHLSWQNQDQFAGMGSTPWLLVSVHANTALCISFGAGELILSSLLSVTPLFGQKPLPREARVLTHAHPPAPPVHTHQGHPSLWSFYSAALIKSIFFYCVGLCSFFQHLCF